ncbi:MAG TPA: phospholipase D family protein [Mucilaginibacter sp.]|jgi:hypothetical protein
MEIYLKNWHSKFIDELKKTDKLKIISPFINEQLIRTTKEFINCKKFELITRFNLRDFASNVSSIDGLKVLVESGSKIFGIRDLHSKVYLFDNRAAVITSANFTNGGLKNNLECGMYVSDINIIKELHEYFNGLKLVAGSELSLELCDKWKSEISNSEIYNTKTPSLPDYGASQFVLNENINYYIKFLGTGHDRVSLDFTSKQEIERALCHYACGFSKHKKPKQFNEGDIIYLARMIHNPTDYAIFGKAEAIKFMDGRDEATSSEIIERPWKAIWPIYLRVKNPVFINGIMGDCVLLYDIIKKLDYESFESTKKRYEIYGERQINPYRSLSQQAYVKLTKKAVEWLEPKFQQSLKNVGQVEFSFINGLPKSNMDL